MGTRAKATPEVPTAAPNRTSSKRPRVSRDEALVRKAMAIHDAERERFVEDLKRAIWNNEYEPDANAIATAIIAERGCDGDPEY